MTADFNEKISRYISVVNERLDAYRKQYDEETAPYCGKVTDAMWSSLSAGGKRIRPVLVMEFAAMCGADPYSALPAAAALEMIHTFSLIHDDLPCMDDDDLRRGRPSCHKAHGEALALLAGDALENLAFGVIADDSELSAETRISLVRELSDAVGVLGMIGGQVIDIENVGGNVFSDDKLLKMYSMKTSALIRCACKMGCICAGAYDMLPYAEKYGEYLGLAFQITDDILDITADSSVTGKTSGSDAELGKSTYASIHGIEDAEKYAAELTAKALGELCHFDNTGFTEELTRFLLDRDK